MASKKKRSAGNPKITFREIIDSGKMMGVIELNSQIRSIVISRNSNICATCCNVVDTPCARGQECAAFKFLMGLVNVSRKVRRDAQ